MRNLDVKTIRIINRQRGIVRLLTLAHIIVYTFAVFLTSVSAGDEDMPVDVRVDKLINSAKENIVAEKWEDAVRDLEEVIKLGVKLPDKFHFHYGMVLFKAGNYEKSLKSMNKYLVTAGGDGKYYKRALGLAIEAKYRQEAAGQGNTHTPKEELKRIEENMVFIKSGCFKMGNTFGDGNEGEKPVHKVCVDDFYIGRYEITNGQFVVFLNDVSKRGVNREFWFTINKDEYCYISGDPDNFRVESGYENNPVACVSWYGAVAFAEWASEETGLNYHLPTEVEWEYAARGGGKKEKWSGTSSEFKLGEYAWYRGNSWNKTHPVGQKKPNELGLYDMSGNIWEWIQDWYDDDYNQNNPGKSPKLPSDTSARIVRGGSCDNTPMVLRATNRVGYTPVGRGFDIGFRLAMTP